MNARHLTTVVPSAAAVAAAQEPASLDHQTHDPNRSFEMQLMHEDLARAHSQQRLEETVRRERSRRLVLALRASRRAEESVMRTRRILASVVVG